MMKTAVRLLLLTALCMLVFCVVGKHIYISKRMRWSEARKYCMEHHTDLSTVHSQEEYAQLNDIRNNNSRCWIGLYRDDNILKWSDGENATLWMGSQLKDVNKSVDNGCVVLYKNGLAETDCNNKRHFLCFENCLVLVKENKTWEEAMEHCRHHHTDLANLPSKSTLSHALRISKEAQTEHVWTSLHYLADSWLWVNRDSGERQAWHQEMPQCPAWSLRCGVISLEGKAWGSWDCGDKLNFICSKNTKVP